MEKTTNIGTISDNYAYRRLVLNKFKDVRYKDVRWNNSFLLRNSFRLLMYRLGWSSMSPEEAVAKLLYDYKNVFDIRCDVLHLFNTINHNRKQPWVISVESGVPWPLSVTKSVESELPNLAVIRQDKYVADRIRILAQPNCLGLLPLSKCSYNIQMEILRAFPEYYEAIKRKTLVLHPSQELQIHNIEEKGLTWKSDELFTFCYVGRNYFRKGGRESVEVLDSFRKKYQFKLILVSSLTPDEEKYMKSSDEVEQTRRFIEGNGDWIEYYPSLPNEQVIEKLKQSHVCLCPTWMDTYAYSVLESQSCGTPLITTSLRALPETNTDEVGWRINVPVNALGCPLVHTQEERVVFRAKLMQGLAEKIEYVLNNREEVKRKSAYCLERIANNHNPVDYAAKLMKIYNGEISSLIVGE